MGERHQSSVHHHNCVRREIRIEALLELGSIGTKAGTQELLEPLVVSLDPLADLGLIERAVCRGVDGQAAPLPPLARAIWDEPDEPLPDRFAGRPGLGQDALRPAQYAVVIAIQHLQEKRGLVAEGRIESRLRDAALRSYLERGGLEALTPKDLGTTSEGNC